MSPGQASAWRRARRSDFSGGAAAVAERLIGALLVHEIGAIRLSGRIVEVEAYLSQHDAASHSRSGPTRRNASMFLASGHAYVYRIYGLHHCFNVVTGEAGVGEAVLVRALEPLEGLAQMACARQTSLKRQWCSGPAKLVEALQIPSSSDGADLLVGALRIEFPRVPEARAEIVVGPRIGITQAKDLALRYCLAQSPWLSRAPPPVDRARGHST